MDRCSFFCKGWPWAFLLLPLVLLLPLLFFQWHSIETDVASNARAKLNAAESKWPDVTTFHRGRDVLLSGTAPNQLAVAEAKTIALSGDGVRVVDATQVDIAEPLPKNDASLNALVTSGSLILRGTVADQASIDSLVADAAKVFGKANVVNKLRVGKNVAALPNINGLFSTLAGDGNLGTLSAAVDNKQLTLKGDVLGADVKARIGGALGKLFPSGIDNQLNVVAPVKRDVCQDLVNELLASSTINFASGKAIIKEDSNALLASIADTAKRCQDARFEVSGHTDSTGNTDFNMTLSQKRAQAVVTHLAGLGLSSDQFTTAGYGPNQPVATNSTSAGRAANRRIEFKLKN